MIGQGTQEQSDSGHYAPPPAGTPTKEGEMRAMASRTIAKLVGTLDALALPDIGSGRWGRAHNRIFGHPPHRSRIVGLPWGFFVLCAKGG